MASETEVATITNVTKTGNGITVFIRFLDGDSQSLTFSLPTDQQEIEAAICLKVADKNRLIEAVADFQTLIGREIR
jgi:hypothetical protein